IDDPIITPNVNLFIADCYNYYGNNPNFLDNGFANCEAVQRGGGDIFGIRNPDNQPSGNYRATNGGKIKNSGFDYALAWTTDAPGGVFSLQWLLQYTIEAKQSDGEGLPTIDYAGTIAYFGADLGQSFPEWKWNLTGAYSWRDFLFDGRIRWIDSMDNRAAVQYPGETSLTGVGSATYVDIGTSWTFATNYTLRLGINNLFDEDPQEYAPNVQSGTDPSLYDIVGRRYHFSFRATF
ncbi:MAG: TonB-dependent receptor, partial [Pseudomonadota bacterium]